MTRYYLRLGKTHKKGAYVAAFCGEVIDRNRGLTLVDGRAGAEVMSRSDALAVARDWDGEVYLRVVRVELKR